MPGRRFITLEGAEELRRLAENLRRNNEQEINDRLRSELTDLARPLASQVRASVRATPSKGQSARMGKPSLRSKVARAVEVKVRTTRRPTVQVWVNPARMPPGERNLPGYLDGVRPFHRWRHPTFGHRPWITQPAHPYFDRATRRAGPAMTRAGERVVEQIAREIER